MKMIARHADRARLAGEIALARHGLCARVLVGVLALLVVAAAIVLPAQNAELARRTATLAELETDFALHERPAAAAQRATLSSEQAGFAGVLAGEDEVLAAIESLLASAAAHGLVATRADYQRALDAEAQAARVQIALPLRGHYQDVRRWIEDVLAGHPYLAINDLSFKREEARSDEIDARVRLTIFHRASAPDAERPAVRR